MASVRLEAVVEGSEPLLAGAKQAIFLKVAKNEAVVINGKLLNLRADDLVSIKLDESKVTVFDADTEKAICYGELDPRLTS